MKPEKQHHCKLNSIPTGRWVAYAAAAAASSFAAASSAEATIHYSGLIKQKFKGDQRFSFLLDPAGGVLVFKHWIQIYGSSSYHDGGTASFHFYAAVSGGANAVTTSHGHVSVSNLNRGDAISAGPFAPDGGTLAARTVRDFQGGSFKSAVSVCWASSLTMEMVSDMDGRAFGPWVTQTTNLH